MIDLALNFLLQQVNAYLRMKLDPASNAEFIQLSNISHFGQDEDVGINAASQNAFLSLVNIEEDRISKSQENFVRKENSVVYKNPKVFLNLYALFSVNLNNYTEALKRLSLIIQFFQYRSVFDITNSPSLDPKIEKLLVEMYTLNFEQSNQMWATLGGKYLPSVLYKVRLIGIEEDAIDAESGFIKSIGINENNN
jgi:hypothetical protein